MIAHSNANQPNFPAAPDAINNWKLFTAIRDDINDIGTTNEEQVRSRVVRRLLLRDLVPIARVIC